MRPEVDLYAYVQDLEKHLQLTVFGGGAADPEAPYCWYAARSPTATRTGQPRWPDRRSSWLRSCPATPI